jgi:predicted amidohydrolase
MIRVAVLQIENQLEPAAAVSLCARLVDRAVVEQTAQIVLFPELVAHDDELGAGESRLAGELSTLAARHAIWVLGSLSVAGRPVCLWADPTGQVHTRPCSDLEQTGAGSFLAECALISTPHGKIGLCAGPGALRSRVSRALTLAGARLICTSLASCSPRALGLHPVARALENEVFFAVSALRREPARPYPAHEETLPPQAYDADGARSHSQISGPSGQRMELSSCAEGAIWVAELALMSPELESDAEQTSLATAPGSRRAAHPRGLWSCADTRDDGDLARELTVATLTIAREASLEETLLRSHEQVRELVKQGVSLIVLPELFCFEPELSEPEHAAAELVGVVRALADACRHSASHVVTSLVERVKDQYFHTAVAIGQGGIVVRQVQLAATDRLPWATPGRRVQTARLPWGRLALCLGEDALLPEFAHTLIESGVDVLAAPLALGCAARAALTLPAMAEEGSYGVVAALPAAGPDGQRVAGGFIVDPSQWHLHVATEVELGLQATLDLAAVRTARA